MRSYFLLGCAILLLAVADTRGQRCGDDVWLYVRDSESNIISPELFDSVRVAIDDGEAETLNLNEANALEEVPKGIKSISIRSACGFRSLKISLSYRGAEMILNLRNVPGDAGNILLESVPFRVGTFAIDLEGWKLKNCESDRSIEEPLYTRGGSPLCVIRESKWKSSNTDRGSSKGEAKADLLVVLSAPDKAKAAEDIAQHVKVLAKNIGAAMAPKPSDIVDLYTSAKVGYQIDLVLSTDGKVPIRFAEAPAGSAFSEDMLLVGGRISYDIVDLPAAGSKEYRFGAAILPSDISTGTYFLCAVIDPGKTVLEIGRSKQHLLQGNRYTRHAA